MQITKEQYEKFLDDQIGKPCVKHGRVIKWGIWGNWCGEKDEYGAWCGGNDYPHLNEELVIK